jgi:hypothetical protein
MFLLRQQNEFQPLIEEETQKLTVCHRNRGRTAEIRTCRWLSGIDQFYDRAVIIQGRATAEIGDRSEDFLHPGTLASYILQALVVIKIPPSILGFSDTVCNNDEAIPGSELNFARFVGRIRQKSDGQISHLWPGDMVIGNQEWRHMPAIHIFEFAIAIYARNYYGRVLLPQVLLSEEAIHSCNYVGQWHLRNQM